VNLSLSGDDEMPEEKHILSNLVHNTKVVVSAGNDYKDLDLTCNVYPVCYKIDLYVVGALKRNKIQYPSSNYNGPVKYWEVGENVHGLSGTSPAAAIFSNKLLRGIK